jgi:hypothetical protein
MDQYIGDSPIIQLKTFFTNVLHCYFNVSLPPLVIYTDTFSYKRLVLGLKASINDRNGFKLIHKDPYLCLLKEGVECLTLVTLSFVFGEHKTWNNPVDSKTELSLQVEFLQHIDRSMMGLYQAFPSLLTQSLGKTSGLLHYSLYEHYSRHQFELKLALLGLEESLKLHDSPLLSKLNHRGELNFYYDYIQPLLAYANDPASNKLSPYTDLSDQDLKLLIKWAKYFTFSSKTEPQYEKNYAIPYEYSLLFDLGFKDNLLWTNQDYLSPQRGVSQMYVYDVNSLFPFVLSISPMPQGIPEIITDKQAIDQIIGNIINFKDFTKEPESSTGYDFYGNLKSYLNYLIGDKLGFARVSYIAPAKNVQTTDTFPPYAPLGVRGIRWLSLTDVRYLKSLKYQITVETIFLYKESIDFSTPINTLGYIKATGKTIDSCDQPELIQLNKKIAKNLLNAFWGKTLNKGSIANFEISETTENLFTDKIFNTLTIDKNNTVIFMKKIEDLILQTTVPGYKLNNNSYALATSKSINDYYNALRILAHGYRDRRHHKFKDFTRSRLELETMKNGLKLYKVFNKAIKGTKLVDEIYLPNHYRPTINKKEPWPFIINLEKLLLANKKKPNLQSRMSQDLLKHRTKIPKKLNGQLNKFYSPEIGLETLTRARIYMHLLSSSLRDYQIIKINNDALHLGRALPSYLLSKFNFGRLKFESGPYSDRFLFYDNINAAYYGNRFYFADLPNIAKTYDIVKYHEPLAFNKAVFDTGEPLNKFTPGQVCKLTNRRPFNHSVILKWGFEAQAHWPALPLIYGYFGLANSYPPIKLEKHAFWYTFTKSEHKTYLEILLNYYYKNRNKHKDPSDKNSPKHLWHLAKDPVIAYKLIINLPK